MEYLVSAAVGLLAGLAFNLIYRRIQSEWPESYFSLSDYWSYVKALAPRRYILFRFGPVLLVSLFCSHQLNSYDLPNWPFLVTTATVHLGSTSLRAAWRIRRYRRVGGRNVPLLVLHLLTAVTVVALLIGGLLIRDHLSYWIPDFESIRESIWAGLFSSLLAFAFIRSTQARDNDLIDVVKTQKKRIGTELIGYARDSAERKGLDPDLVETVILTESIQRPRWFRRLEFVKGVVFRKGTYGIMQVQSPHPIRDRKSIDEALRTHRSAFEPQSQDRTSTSIPDRLRGYNSSQEFLDLAYKIYWGSHGTQFGSTEATNNSGEACRV